MYYVYILKSGYKRNWHYIGSSKDPQKRVQQHNKGKERSTKGYRPLKLIYTEEYITRSTAFRREMYYKTAEGKKALKERLSARGLW